MIRNVVAAFGSPCRVAVFTTVIVVSIAACSGESPAPLVGGPTTEPSVAESLLATEAASVAPAATRKPTPKPTKKPTAKYYKPPGWDGSSDVNCKDFDTHAHAQSFFKGTGGSKTSDPYGLDGDHDAIACELLP
jgi:hypothetical protein